MCAIKDLGAECDTLCDARPLLQDFKRLIWEQGTPELMEIDFSDM